MDFPEWINQDVKDLVEILDDQINKLSLLAKDSWAKEYGYVENKKTILERIILSDDCKKAWEDNDQLWLAITILKCMPNERSPRKTKGNINNWAEKIIDLCAELNNALSESPLEKQDVRLAITHYIYNSLRIKDDPLYLNIMESIRDHFKNDPNLEEFIATLSNNLDFYISCRCLAIRTEDAIDSMTSAAKNEPVVSLFWGEGTSNSAHAERGYFVRALTNAYKKKEDRPCRSQVKAIIKAAQFGQIDDSDLRRQTKDIVSNNGSYPDIVNDVNEYKYFLTMKDKILKSPFPNQYFMYNIFS